MKIRIHTVDGGNITFDVSQPFDFVNLCLTVRDTGRIINSAFYIPHEMIVSMVLLGDDEKPMQPEKATMGTLQ